LRGLLDADGRRSLVGAASVIVQPLLLNLAALPVTAYIIATLGPLAYGQWSVALTLTTTAAFLTNIGLRNWFIRAVARTPENAARAFAEQLGLRVLLAAAAGLLSMLICALLGYPAVVSICAGILAVGMMFTAAAAVVADLLQAFERLPSLATINLTSGLTLTAVSALAMWLRAGPIGLALAYLIGPVLTGTVSLWLVHRSMFPVRVAGSPSRYWALIVQARVMGLQQFIAALGNQAENLMVPKLVGLSVYGQFAAGTLLLRRMEIVPDGVSTAMYPVMAKTFHQDVSAGARAVTRFAWLMTAACVPATLLVFVLADPIARLLFPDPEICRQVIKTTVWWVPLLGAANVFGYSLNAAGREVTEVRNAITATVLGLLCSVVLVWQFGLAGACVALVVKGVLHAGVRLPTFTRMFRATRGVHPVVADVAIT